MLVQVCIGIVWIDSMRSFGSHVCKELVLLLVKKPVKNTCKNRYRLLLELHTPCQLSLKSWASYISHVSVKFPINIQWVPIVPKLPGQSWIQSVCPPCPTRKWKLHQLFVLEIPWIVRLKALRPMNFIKGSKMTLSSSKWDWTLSFVIFNRLCMYELIKGCGYNLRCTHYMAIVAHACVQHTIQNTRLRDDDDNYWYIH